MLFRSLDVHSGDDQAELAEDDVHGQLLDLLELQAQQALGGVLHHAGLGGHAHGEPAGHVDADVLAGQGVLQIHGDGHGGQIQELIGLDHRPDEGRAAVDALGAAGGAVLVAAHLTVDDHHPVGGALLVPLDDEHQQGKDDEDDDADQNHAEDTVKHELSSFTSYSSCFSCCPDDAGAGSTSRMSRPARPVTRTVLPVGMG